MREFHIEIEIHAPPEPVWRIIRDIQHWPDWTPTVTSIRQLDPGPLAVGTRALIRQPKLLPAKWRVTELDENHRSFTWVTRSPGVQVTACHSVAPGGAGSKATLSIAFSGLLGSFVARLTSNLNQRYLALEAQGLRDISEGKLKSPRPRMD